MAEQLTAVVVYQGDDWNVQSFVVSIWSAYGLNTEGFKGERGAIRNEAISELAEFIMGEDEYYLLGESEDYNELVESIHIHEIIVIDSTGANYSLGGEKVEIWKEPEGMQ